MENQYGGAGTGLSVQSFFPYSLSVFFFAFFVIGFVIGDGLGLCSPG